VSKKTPRKFKQLATKGIHQEDYSTNFIIPFDGATRKASFINICLYNLDQ